MIAMTAHKVVCWECGAEVTDPYANLCPKCNGLLTVKMDLSAVSEINPEDLIRFVGADIYPL